MKKILFLLLLISLSLATKSWGQIEHMKFMGIPIDGKVYDFTKKIEKKGLVYYTKVSNSYLYKGSFAGNDADIFVIFENSTKKVFGVGVYIKCYSEKIARDKYWGFVRDLKYKYNAQKLDDILDLYKENPGDLYQDIIKGKFQGFNSITTDSIKNTTEIDISKVEYNDSDSLVLKSSLGMGMLYLSLKYSGNVGSIIVKYNKEEDSYGSDNYRVAIIYRDEQNALEAYKRNQDDL